MIITTILEKCLKKLINAPFDHVVCCSKRIQGTVAQRKLRLGMDPGSPHIYICDYHKSVIQVTTSPSSLSSSFLLIFSLFPSNVSSADCADEEEAA